MTFKVCTNSSPWLPYFNRANVVRVPIFFSINVCMKKNWSAAVFELTTKGSKGGCQNHWTTGISDISINFFSIKRFNLTSKVQVNGQIWGSYSSV